MKLRAILGGLAAMSVMGATLAGAATAKGPTDLDILKSYAADFASDKTLTSPVEFGVRVGEVFYTVTAAPGDARVRKGAPATPTFFFTVEDSAWLRKVDRGEVNALTSMAKAFSSDYAPMDIDVMDGFQPDAGFVGMVVPLTFHFWTRGTPEYVPFGPDMTRVTHGTNTGVFYYQPGLRSAWFNVEPGDHVNENEKSRENPFPSMVIMTKGEITAIIDGEKSTFKEGTMLFIPAGVTHEFINEGTEPAFGFLFMFGEGA